MGFSVDGILLEDEFGVRRVSGTRVTLDNLIYSFWEGCSAETIADQFDAVPLADIYLVLGYYLKNRDEVDAYLQKQRECAEEIQARWEQKFPPHGLRARLLARQAASA